MDGRLRVSASGFLVTAFSPPLPQETDTLRVAAAAGLCPGMRVTQSPSQAAKDAW